MGCTTSNLFQQIFDIINKTRYSLKIKRKIRRKIYRINKHLKLKNCHFQK
jgi:hypothetical protein